MPERGDTAICAECGDKIEWHYKLKIGWAWLRVVQYSHSTIYCYPFKDWDKTHRPKETSA